MAVTTVFGGTGFLGHRIVERLVARGDIVRVATRHPERVQAGINLAATGRVVPTAADVREAKSVATAIAEADQVVNAVSAYTEKGGVTYRAVHVDGALNVARACQQQRISRLVHISGIGADPASKSPYICARGLGEQKVREAFAAATVLRPSVMFADDDGFLNAIAAVAKLSPVIPLIGGGRTRLQPIRADDVADAVCVALQHPLSFGVTYEIGGPNGFTLRQIVEMVLARTGRKRTLLPVPFTLAYPLAHLLEHLPQSPLTVAQVDLLKADNVPAPDLPGLPELAITPHRIQDVIEGLRRS